MNELPARAGQIVDLHSESTPGSPQQQLVVRSGDVQIRHFVVPSGAEIPTHEAQGEIVLHCLLGRVQIIALGNVQEMLGDQLLYLATNEPFSIRGVEDSALLATIILPKQGDDVPLVGN